MGVVGEAGVLVFLVLGARRHLQPLATDGDRNPNAARDMMREHLEHTKKAQEREKLLSNGTGDGNGVPPKQTRKRKS